MYIETAIIALILLLPPLILWRWKTFSEKRPSSVAWRSVPFGCLTMMLLPLLSGAVICGIYQMQEKNRPHWLDILGEPLVILLSIIAGIVVIVCLAKRLSKGRELPHFFTFVGAFVLNAIVVLIVSCIYEAGTNFMFQNNSPRNWEAIYLPRQSDTAIAFEQRASHPFLAEYDYRLRLRHDKETKYFMLWPNTGGRTFINAYQFPDGRLLLKNKDAHYLVDPANMQVFILDSSVKNGKPPQSGVPLDNTKICSMGTTDDNFEVSYPDNICRKSTPIEIDISQCKYIGCIMDHSFYTPDEQSEGEEHPRYRN